MENLKSGFEFIFSSYKRTATILFIGALTLAIPITITLVGQQQDIRQRAATSLTLPTLAFGEYMGSGTLFFESVLDPEKYNLNYSAGHILRQQWVKIEPQDDVFNWTYLDNSLQELKTAGKKGVIRIVAGPNSPDWLRTQYNVKTVCWQQSGGRSPSLNCFPWMTDAKYREERKEMQQALYYHYTTERPDLEQAISFVGFSPPKQSESDEVSYVRNPGWTIYLSNNGSSGIPIGVYCVANRPEFSYCPPVESLPQSTFANEGYSDSSLYQMISNSIIDAYSAMPTWYIAIMHSGGNAISPLELVQNNYNTILNNGLEDRVMIGFTGLARISNLDPDTKAIYDDIKLNFFDRSNGKAKIGWQPAGDTPTSELYEAWCELAAPMSSKWLEPSGSRWPNSDLEQIFLSPDCGSPTPTGIPPTITPTPTPTGIPPGTTSLNITITMTGIGNASSSALGINNNPKRPQRNTEVSVINSQNLEIASFSGQTVFNLNSGNYEGTIDLGINFATGSYLVKVRLDNTLWETIPGIQNITSGQTYTAPETNLVSGDIIQDNEINLLDYNALLSCYGDNACTAKAQADANDDDKVDELDINILYAGFAKRVGD